MPPLLPAPPLRFAARALLTAVASFALEEAYFYDPFKTFAAQTHALKTNWRDGRKTARKCERDGSRTQKFSLPFSIFQVMV